MITTAIESPFSGTPEQRLRNARYLAWCLKDCYDRGEAAYAGHGLGPTAYPEDPVHRRHGLDADVAMADACQLVAYYVDLGWSKGMVYGHNARLSSEWSPRAPLSMNERTLKPADYAAFERGEWPPGATMRLVPTELWEAACHRQT